MSQTTTTTAANKNARIGYVPLGYDGADNVIWSNARRCVARLKAAEINQPTLETWAGLEWLLNNYLDESSAEGKSTRKLNVTRARSEMIAACQAAGKFESGQVMGAGVWRVQLNGATAYVCNSGGTAFTADGHEVPRISAAGVFAESRSLGMAAGVPSATDSEVLELARAIESWNWRNPSDTALVIGWLAIAPFAGALDRRPALNITGPRGSGKSTLLDALARLFGSAALKADGASSSAAGIRQFLEHDARPVILDEFGDNIADSLREKERIAAIVAQIRTGYSDETGDGAVKGTSDGKGASYSTRYSALLSGIVPPPMQPADRTRLLLCSLGTLPRGARFPVLFADPEALNELGSRIRMRVFRLLPQLLASIKAMRLALIKGGNSPRFADTVGTALAGWHVLMTGTELTADDAVAVLSRVNLSEHAQALEGASDEREAADWLLGYTSPTTGCSLGEMVASVRDGHKEHLRALELHGLKLSESVLQVCGAKSLKGIREVFNGSKFADGGWTTVLERAPDAKECKPRFAGKSTRSVAIPLWWLFGEDRPAEQGALGL